MSMELLGNEFIEEFYSAADANRARRVHFEGIVGVFPWIATVDAFQHWIYTHPNHTRAERAAAWLELMDRFGGDVDWSGLRGRAGAFVAPAASHFPASVLLHRIRHRATRRVAGLGKFKARQGEGVERLQKIAGAGRLASVAGIVSAPPAANLNSARRPSSRLRKCCGKNWKNFELLRERLQPILILACVICIGRSQTSK